MPELPDLTVFAENLGKAVIGKKIAGIEYQGSKNARTSTAELTRALGGSTVTKVERVGKRVCFGTDNGGSFCVHLMLTGGFVLRGADAKGRIDFPVLKVTFGDGSLLAVEDPKGWANVTLNPEPDEAPDALEVSAEYLREKFRKRPRTQVKAFLLDQQMVGGIGNAYSDEILWQARISPKSQVGKLPPEAVDALVAAIPAVLNEATDYLRKHHPDIVAGEYREFLKVHGPTLKHSPTGSRIVKEQILSKKTYYTDEQTLYE